MKNTGKTVFSVAAIMMMTKVVTMVANLLYMAHFGVTDEINIYSYALNVPNIIFNCIGTALNTVVIPIYLTLVAENNKDGAKKFLDDIITISCILILVLVIGGFFAAPLIASLAGYGGGSHGGYAVMALRILMPVMLFHGINYIFQGIMQANGRFKLPAFVSAPTSITIILYVLIFGHRFGVTGLLYATLLGMALQPLIMVPAIRDIGYRYQFSFGVKSSPILQAGRATVPVLISVSSYQINMLFNSTLASRFGTIAIMTYVQNIALVSILSVVYAISSVYFPKLTALWAQKDREAYKDSLSEIMMVICFLLIPASFGFIMLKDDLGNFLANWGNIGPDNARIAGNMLGLYGAGVAAIGLKEILDKAFYAQKDTKTPAIFGFVIMAGNVILSLIFLQWLGTYSMPLSYSLSSFIGASGLMMMMNRRIRLVNRHFFYNLLKCILAGAVMSIILYFEIQLLADVLFGGGALTRLLKILIPVGTGVLTYFGAAFLFKIPQARQLTAMVSARLKS